MLLSPPIVVYSPRVVPVYVYDAHADCGKNVRYSKEYLFHLECMNLLVNFIALPYFFLVDIILCDT